MYKLRKISQFTPQATVMNAYVYLEGTNFPHVSKVNSLPTCNYDITL